ncbi:MAG: helix-turn-helix domain-containing protein [Chloroflexota bacterium]
MASEEGLALRPDMRQRLEAIARRRAEKEAEERTAQRLLRQKILGVLIRRARLEAGKSIKEAAEVLDCSPDRLSQYESGERALSLPETEMLARFFGVPLDDLLDETRQPETTPAPPPAALIDLRHKIIGVELRQARQTAGLTLNEVAEKLGCSPHQVSQYERGVRPIPLPELEALAGLLNLRFSTLVDAELGPDNPQARLQRNLERLALLPEPLQDFVLNPVNALYIEMAMKVSQLPVGTLRQIAEGLLDITY